MQADRELHVSRKEPLTARLSRNRYWVEFAIVFLAYCLAGKLGQATTNIRSNNLGPVWPAYGVALASVVLCGFRIWPAILAGSFVIAWSSPVLSLVALGQACAGTLAALIGGFLLNRVALFRPTLLRLRDALSLILLGAFTSALISSCFGTAVLLSAHVRPYTGLTSAWLIYWLGDSTGVLLVTPFLLTLPSLAQIRQRRLMVEFECLLVLLIVATLSIFSGSPFVSVNLDFLAFGVLPFVMWAAIRMGVAGTALSVLVIAVIATVATALGAGPFGGGTPFRNAVFLDVFFVVISITGLTLASAIQEAEETASERTRRLSEETLLEGRLRLASIVESSDDAIIGADAEGKITDWNNGAERLFGFIQEEAVGKPLNWLLAEDAQAELRQILDDSQRTPGKRRYESRCQRKDGTSFEAAVTISPILNSAGRNRGRSVIVHDITLQKRQESALRESESLFRLVADSAPVLIWMSDTTRLCTYFNKPWLDFTGQSFQSQLGDGWAEGVHEDDRQRCVDHYMQSFDRHENFRMEYRLRRYDGEYRWVLDFGVPRFNANGSLAGYIGSCVDITESKLAEEAMSNVSRRLIEAQEKERTRIARELHDDITQRLALLVIEIEQSKLDVVTADQATLLRSGFSQRVQEISDDIQAISHDLHSSKLEHLGMLAAIRGFCRELAAAQKLEIDFKHNEVPQNISSETALTLFRILQEALHNALKHSQVRHFHVDLHCTSQHLELRVADSGVGFNPENETAQQGLGLVSMRERARLANGTVQIDSHPMKGTIVHLRLPLVSTSFDSNASSETSEEQAPDVRREAS